MYAACYNYLDQNLISRIEQRLFNTAHIVSDKHGDLGQRVVHKVLPLSKLHNSAFYAHLIGMDTNYKFRASDRLVGRNE